MTLTLTLTVNVQEAKTRLSELLHRAEAGEEIVIARAGVAVARLQAIQPRKRSLSQLLLPGLPAIDAEVLLAPMDSDELLDWENGHDGDPLSNGDDEE